MFKVKMKDEPIKVEHLTVVRLSSSCWYDKNGIYYKRALKFLRKKCKGLNVIYDECGAIDVDDIYSIILNINECDDGIYEVVVCDEMRDWETGYIDNWNYKLIKLENGLI